MYETCWSLCIQNDSGNGVAAQNWDEALCQRNCLQKFNNFQANFKLKNSAAQFYRKKISEKARSDPELKSVLSPIDWKENVIKELNLKETIG